jgi:hypothetical protein
MMKLNDSFLSSNGFSYSPLGCTATWLRLGPQPVPDDYI